MLKACGELKALLHSMWPVMPTVVNSREPIMGEVWGGVKHCQAWAVSAKRLFVLGWISALAFVLRSDALGWLENLARNSQFQGAAAVSLKLNILSWWIAWQEGWSAPDRKGPDIFHKRSPPPSPSVALSFTPAVSSEGTPGLPCQLYPAAPSICTTPAKLTPSFKDRPKYLTRGFLQLSHGGLACHSETTLAPKQASRSIISSCHPPSNQVVNRLSRTRPSFDQSKRLQVGPLTAFIIWFWTLDNFPDDHFAFHSVHITSMELKTAKAVFAKLCGGEIWDPRSEFDILLRTMGRAGPRHLPPLFPIRKMKERKHYDKDNRLHLTSFSYIFICFTSILIEPQSVRTVRINVSLNGSLWFDIHTVGW